MPDIELKIFAGEEIAGQLTEAASGLREVVLRELRAGQLKLASAMSSKIASNFHRRSGKLERIVIEEIGADFSGRVGSTTEYAEIRDRGGTIVAKNARNLTIPLEAFMTGRGIAKGSARDVIASPDSYGFDGTFFSKGILFGKQGSDAVALFLLKPSVTLTARPYAQPAVDEIQPAFEASLHHALEALL